MFRYCCHAILLIIRMWIEHDVLNLTTHVSNLYLKCENGSTFMCFRCYYSLRNLETADTTNFVHGRKKQNAMLLWSNLWCGPLWVTWFHPHFHVCIVVHHTASSCERIITTKKNLMICIMHIRSRIELSSIFFFRSHEFSANYRSIYWKLFFFMNLFQLRIFFNCILFSSI